MVKKVLENQVKENQTSKLMSQSSQTQTQEENQQQQHHQNTNLKV